MGLSKEHILQITNDIAEDMLSSKITKKELVEVVRFWVGVTYEEAGNTSLLRSSMMSDLVRMIKKLGRPASKKKT